MSIGDYRVRTPTEEIKSFIDTNSVVQFLNNVFFKNFSRFNKIWIEYAGLGE